MRSSSLLVALAMALASGDAVLAAESPSREYQIKAAFLYSFTKFVEWPGQSLPEPSSPIVIGVLGPDPFHGELQQAVANRHVHGHPVVARRVEDAEDAAGVHVLFVATQDEAELKRVLPALATHPVLTVGESPEFTNLGGIITFVLLDEKVRFAIDMTAAHRAGLVVSSQLQKLATKKVPGVAVGNRR